MGSVRERKGLVSKKDLKIGGEWKRWRTGHLMTQADLGAILGISREAVHHIEVSRKIPRLSTQAKMKTLMKQHEKEKQNASSAIRR